ncbi:hypothetical protein GYB22_12330 [bacterium]|nr:hypothetical protein [bacterium]
MNRLIERVDWHINLKNRIELVEQVESGELKPNHENFEEVCQLPFKFPIVSVGGNQILIYSNDSSSGHTIMFWTNKPFFTEPSTFYVYTTEKNQIEFYNKLMVNTPNENWKVSEHWYRVKLNL